MADSDDDVLIVGQTHGGRPPRISREEDAMLPGIREGCTGPIPLTLRGIGVERQSSDTCLVHAMVNAIQQPERLTDMLRATARAGRYNGWERRDVASGVVALKEVCGITMRNAFDPAVHRRGVAHLYSHGGDIDHFVAIVRVGSSFYMLDSLDGTTLQVFDMDSLARRATIYGINEG